MSDEIRFIELPDVGYIRVDSIVRYWTDLHGRETVFISFDGGEVEVLEIRMLLKDFIALLQSDKGVYVPL
jgi:hypothetical protein